MTLKYSHTQKGRFWFKFMLVAYIVMVVLCVILLVQLFSGGVVDGKERIAHCSIVTIVLLEFSWFTALMRSLAVTVDDRYIRLAFGRFALRRKLLLSDIESCKVVKNHWWWMGLKGRFEIGAKEAVELVFKNGRRARIGTDDPKGLAEAINQVIAFNQKES